MKIIVFGATGGIGRELVQQAMAKAHDVTAFTRPDSAHANSPDNVTVVTGDVTNADAVRDAVNGQDAVLCALGAPLSSKAQVRARGTLNIVNAMQASGVRRLISVSALGVGDSRDLLPWSYKYFLIPLFMRSLYADHALQERYIGQSQTDWTIVRPGVLTDGPRTGHYRIGLKEDARPRSPKISRADVADFMIGELSADAYFFTRPFVAY